MNNQKRFLRILLIVFFIVTGLFLYVKINHKNTENNKRIDFNEEKGKFTSWRLYKNEEYGFEFEYPSDWLIEIKENDGLYDGESGAGGYPKGVDVFLENGAYTWVLSFYDKHDTAVQYGLFSGEGEYLNTKNKKLLSINKNSFYRDDILMSVYHGYGTEYLELCRLEEKFPVDDDGDDAICNSLTKNRNNTAFHIKYLFDFNNWWPNEENRKNKADKVILRTLDNISETFRFTK